MSPGFERVGVLERIEANRLVEHVGALDPVDEHATLLAKRQTQFLQSLKTKTNKKLLFF